MKFSYSKVGVVCILIVSFLVYVSLVAYSEPAVQHGFAVPSSTPPEVAIPEGLPTVDYYDNTANRPDEGRSRKYEKAMQVLIPDVTRDIQSVSMGDWYVRLGALPVKESSLVVVGKVDSVRAVLPPSKKTVFTVTAISIERVLSNSAGKEVKAGQLVETEREGGVVRFPNGKRIWHQVAGQNLPKPGTRGVFFLSSFFPGYGRDDDGFYLVTGFEFYQGNVRLLDSLPPDHPMRSYEGRQEEKLMLSLEKALKGHRED